MILLVHQHNAPFDVLDENLKPTAFTTQKSISDTLFALAETYPEDLIVWCHKEYLMFLDFENIRSIFHHKAIMASYSVANVNYLPPQIGYVEDSPFINVKYDVPYPTWLMSSDVGGIYAEVLNSVSAKEFHHKEFDWFLNSFAGILMNNGLLCYSNPAFLKSGVSAKVSSMNATTFQLFKFIKQHYKTRWTVMAFMSFVIFEKRIPLIPLIRSLGFSRKKDTYELVSQISIVSNLKENVVNEVDVIIPTMGRKPYLHNVLKDLAKQTVLPIRVIIVEQNPKLDSVSELVYLKEENWPFKVIHHFTHQTGACNARNIAINEVKSPWVFMADDDIRIPEITIENVFKFLEAYRCKAFTMSCLRDGEVETEANVHQWRTFGSGCSVVASEFVKTTFYDLSYEFGFGEDVDYGMQLRNKGCDVLYNPNIKLKHLKAEIGGFRKKTLKDWEAEEIQPKPSPTVMLSRLKHTSIAQINGYQLQLFLKFYNKQLVKNPFAYFNKMKKAWAKSVYWAKKLEDS